MSEIKINTAPHDPVLPHVSNLVFDGCQQRYIYAEDGLTKRELFAGLAMVGLLAFSGASFPTLRAKEATEIADELINALNK